MPPICANGDQNITCNPFSYNEKGAFVIKQANSKAPAPHLVSAQTSVMERMILNASSRGFAAPVIGRPITR